jgi:D-psicose/D-tagatose/L-ribulose 3-epimerase
MIDAAGEAGAVAYAGAIYGHPGHVERRRPEADELARAASALHELAEHAAARNVALVLEPMSHFRTHISNTPSQINELIRMVQHANVLSLLDTYHLVTEVDDLAAAFEEMRPRLWGIHACENHRGAPGTGMLPWGSLIAAIVRNGWDGRIGFESYNSTWRDGHFAWERGMFHNVCPDAEAFIRGGKAFLERWFAECAIAQNDERGASAP